MVQPVAFDFEDMSVRADEYLEVVREEAAKIVAEAHQEAEQVRRNAEEIGRQTAQNAIEELLDERVAKQMETLRPAIQMLLSQLEDARGAWQLHWEQSAVKLATDIAQRIIRRELREQPEIALDVIRGALELAAGSADMTVRMNPTDYENLGSQVQQLAESICQLAPADVVADAEVAPGGCRVDTRFGEIDAQIESQLRRVEEELG